MQKIQPKTSFNVSERSNINLNADGLMYMHEDVVSLQSSCPLYNMVLWLQSHVLKFGLYI